jgi:FkbM family methyltransferase
VKALARRLARACGFEIVRLPAHDGVPEVADLGIDDVLEVLFRHADLERFVLIQIGANDGVRNDPLARFIARHRPRAVLVEPQRRPFRALQERYGSDPRITLHYGAIAARAGEYTLYRCREDLGPRGDVAFLSGLASFERARLLESLRRHARLLGPDLAPEQAIVPERVNALTFHGLLERYRLERCDLLAIDTEGHDFEILRTVDFSRIRPALILYEHSHLGVHDQRACWRLLAAAGYRCRAGWADTLALLEAG